MGTRVRVVWWSATDSPASGAVVVAVLSRDLYGLVRASSHHEIRDRRLFMYGCPVYVFLNAAELRKWARQAELRDVIVVWLEHLHAGA